MFQFRQPAFWLYVAVLVATAWYTIGEQTVFRDISAAGWLLSWALLAVYALPVFLAVYFLDLY